MAVMELLVQQNWEKIQTYLKSLPEDLQSDVKTVFNEKSGEGWEGGNALWEEDNFKDFNEDFVTQLDSLEAKKEFTDVFFDFNILRDEPKAEKQEAK